MSLVFNTKTFTADRIGQDSVGYNGPAHTLSSMDDLQVSRVYPKPTVTFSGVGRNAVKLTRTLALTGALTITGNAILQINASIPVGAASADIDALVNDMAAYLATADAKTAIKALQVNF